MSSERSESRRRDGGAAPKSLKNIDPVVHAPMKAFKGLELVYACERGWSWCTLVMGFWVGVGVGDKGHARA